MEAWLLEFGKGIGKLFLNPLFYWIILLVLLTGYRRIKLERQHFGVKIFGYFSEMRGTWVAATLLGILFSIAVMLIGIVFSPSTLIILIIAMIILSINLRSSSLSASYTIGLTYVVLLFSPLFLEGQQIFNEIWLSETNYIELTLLLGFMLLAEAYFMQHVKRKESYPSLVLSERGYWIGHHHLRKMSVIPIFLLVPEGMIEPFASYWPMLTIGDGTYGIVLFPFLLGFSQVVRGSLAPAAGKQLGKQIYIIGILVILISTIGFFVQGMSLVALFVGILGREFIIYRFRVKDKNKAAYYQPHPKGTKVLAIIPETPADRLDIQPGEVITKVNDKKITNPDEFYEALQGSGAYFKLEVLDDHEEIRFVQGAFYEGDHHKLGLIFMKEPYRLKK